MHLVTSDVLMSLMDMGKPIHHIMIVLSTRASYVVGSLRAKYFTLPVDDMNSPSYNKFTVGIDLFWQFTQTLVRAL